MSVADLLNSIGLAEYLPAFEAHAVSEDLLCDLSSADLREIGVLPLGHRKRILAAIADRYDSRQTAEPQADGSSAQHRQVTVLFADLVDSTTLSQALSAEDLRQLIHAYQAVAKDAVERYGGYIAQYLGDGVLAYFGFPRSHEDDAERSIRAGLDLIDGLADVQANFGTRLGVQIKARAGIETGPVIVGDMLGQELGREYAIVGETPNLAARLQAIATPGTLVIGPRTRTLLPSTAQLTPLGPQRLKGFIDAVEAWRVDGLSFGGGRFESTKIRDLSPFVGRDAEFTALQEALARVRAGETACVHILGDPGIGKSRLVHEFRVRAPRTTRMLSGHCTPYGAVVLHPFAQMLSRRAHTRAEVTGIAPGTLLRTEIEALGTELHGDVPYLLRLAGLSDTDEGIDPDVLGARTQAALIRLFGAIGRILPTVLFVNDIHWIDERSEDVLDRLVRHADIRGVLVVCAFRPHYKPPWAGHETVHECLLGPLDAESVEKLYRSRKDAGEDEIVDIVERSGGNPLFVEELATNAKALGSEGTCRKGDAIPSSLSGLLLQRVDGLSPKAQAVLRTASVIGRRFRADLVMTRSAERDLALKELVASGLVIPEDNTVGVLRFKHALVQDAVYDSLLTPHRRSLHARVAHRMEDLYNGTEVQVAEELARHLEVAGELENAARYAFVAGEKALEHFALRDALKWIDRCLALLPDDLDRAGERLRAQAVSNKIQISCWEACFGEMVLLADRELARVRALGEESEVSRTLSWLGEAYLHDGRFVESQEVLEEALAIGEKLADDRCVGYALAELAWLHSIIGAPTEREALEARIERLRSLGRSLGDRLLFTFGAYALWANACHDGRLSDARTTAGELIAYGDETGYPPANCWGRCMAGYSEALSGNADEALWYCDEASNSAECAYDHLAVDLCRGVVLEESGRNALALEIFEQSKSADHSVGSFYFGYTSIVSHGRSLAAVGHMDKSEAFLRSATDHFHYSGHKRATAMSMAALGEVLVRDRARTPEAGKVMHAAAALAAEMGMQGLRARILVARGLIARTSGRMEESEKLFADAKTTAAPLGWLALEQYINAAAAGLGRGLKG